MGSLAGEVRVMRGRRGHFRPVWGAAVFALISFAGFSGPADAENLIENSSFEAGIDYRLAVGRWYVDGLPSARLDKTTRVHGEVSFKIPYSRISYAPGRDVTGMDVRSAIPVRLRAGQRYTFSVYARSSPPAGGRLVLTRNAAGDTKFKPSESKEIRVGRNWQRYSLSYTAKETELIYWSVHMQSADPGHLWLDAAQLAPGWVRPYAPAASVEAALSSDRLGHIFAPDEKVAVTLGIRNNDARSPAAAAYRLRVLDFYGREVRNQVIRKKVPAGKRVMLPVDLKIERRGLFRAVLQRDGARAPESELHFSILPGPRTVEPRDGAFGAYLTIASEPLQIARRIGFSAIATLTSNRRMSYWNQVERRPGQFTWYDRDVEMARAAGFELMFNLEPCRTPRWAGKLSRVERRELWSNYVRALVRRYGHSVKYWTIGDEVADMRKKSPKRNCWTSAAEYAEWHRSGYVAIKSVDPTAKVVLNAWPGFIGKLFKTLDPATVDIAGVNAYHLPDRYLRRVRPELDAAGIAERWAPGIGFAIQPYYRRLIAPRRLKRVHDDSWRALNLSLTKAVVRTFALGFTRLFHYTATYVGNTNSYSLFESDSGLNPMGVQFAALAWLLDGFERVTAIPSTRREARWHAHRVDRRDGKTVFTLWGNSSADQSLHLKQIAGDGLVLYDHFTNRLPVSATATGVRLGFGREPVFLEAPRHRAAEIEKAFRHAVYRVNRLPLAKSAIKKGRFAVLEGVNDGLHRHRPNISLWYQSRQFGWIEILRQRASTYAGRYEPTADGFRVTWDVPAGKGKFFLEPGRFPVELIRGAEFERWLPARNGLRHVRGQIKLDGRPSPTVEKTVSPTGNTMPVDYVFSLANGLKILVDPQPAGTTAPFPQWQLHQRGGIDVFLHRIFARQAAARTITTTISVVE